MRSRLRMLIEFAHLHQHHHQHSAERRRTTHPRCTRWPRRRTTHPNSRTSPGRPHPSRWSWNTRPSPSLSPSLPRWCALIVPSSCNRVWRTTPLRRRIGLLVSALHSDHNLRSSLSRRCSLSSFLDLRNQNQAMEATACAQTVAWPQRSWIWQRDCHCCRHCHRYQR
jgi:hypothetical protein